MKYRRWLVVPALPLRPRPLSIAVCLSVALHLLLVAALVLPHSPKPAVLSPEMGTIELLMVERKGAEPGAAVQPQQDPGKSQPPVAPPTPAPVAPAPVKANPPSQPPLLPTSKQPEDIAVSPPEPIIPPAAAVPAQPDIEAQKAPPSAAPEAAPATQQAPVFNLDGTDSESNAVALGGHILPAQPDDRFRNRPPAYPMEAQMRGEHGTVVVVIHVAENGLAKAVEVLESSGVQVLDQAAVTAVRKWRFHPAMKDGQTIPFDMPFRFVFEAN